ncbi:putative uncharacterized protein DDB_G0282129 [Zerene cesonia]|uniref:putative uncharacterized protein DDB_G0282129 n=1 Tax=Zerene cesonia TaxID=33412 RepID=UPI0018E534AC|nr:putative uncharacterized protein DDB_G0282129 [Zerene cesonia]
MGKARIAMTLLSTLAALVIIVHTAEEEYERAHRGLRARSLDVEVPSYEQAWRALEEPKLPETPQSDAWKDDTPDEIPKRRRTRKRKRRPQISSDDLVAQERHVFHSDVLPRNQEYFVTPPETVRRRKKVSRHETKEEDESNRWGDQPGLERPARRRGHRRKRPDTEQWPRLSEFDGFRLHETIPEENPWNNIGNEQFIDGTLNATNDQGNKEQIEQDGRLPYSLNTEIDDEDAAAPQDDHKIIVSEPLPTYNDRSLSEFSLESLIKPIPDDQVKLKKDKIKEKTKNTISQKEKALLKDKEPLEPQALKAILKRSNGRSLSEILQQNNLSLSDLLQGRDKALSILQTGDLSENHEKLSYENNIESNNSSNNDEVQNNLPFTQSGSQEQNDIKEIIEEQPVTEQTFTTEYIADETTTTQRIVEINSNDHIENTTRTHTRRRFPFHVRRKLRTRPYNNTRKVQLSRDLIALTSRKYQNNRNIQKSKDWIEFMPTHTKNRKIKEDSDVTTNRETKDPMVSENSFISTTVMVEDSTQQFQETENTEIPTTQSSYVDMNSQSFKPTIDMEFNNRNTQENDEIITTDTDETVPTTVPMTSTEKIVTITQKPRIHSHIRPTLNASELRRQAFNNRLNKKRMKQKKQSEEESNDGVRNDVFAMGNLVPASEFIAKTQGTTNANNRDNMTTLDDFTTVTESTTGSQNRFRSTKSPSTRSSIIPKIQPYMSVTEDTAKFEIEEILNDTTTRARLSRILKERNMTLSELVEHRERGSSHVHLADIFHNASKEPNPPEPFLSKSLIEPISKETYPLRALLEANLHDPKSNLDLNALNSNYLNIPVVMDFGNNVNENGENMGIMSLFSNTSRYNENKGNQNHMNTKDIVPSNTETESEQKSGREGRTFNTDKEIVNWNNIFKLLHNNNNQTDSEELLQPRVSSKADPIKKILLEEDDDGDSVIVFEDLQHLNDKNIASSNEENLEVKLLETIEERPSIPAFNTSSNARSVTVVTASIIGLALVLFLLTYAAFKWKQQSKIIESKQCTNEERIPSPVFESRSAKNNSSTRSKSPMLTSNIYSINTLDTHADADSPEYMWDSLRKPFQ